MNTFSPLTEGEVGDSELNPQEDSKKEESGLNVNTKDVNADESLYDFILQKLFMLVLLFSEQVIIGIFAK